MLSTYLELGTESYILTLDLFHLSTPGEYTFDMAVVVLGV